MNITINENNYTFHYVKISFDKTIDTDIFTHKNNKTLAETILTKRYKKFGEIIQKNYPNYLEYPLGEFLQVLKKQGNPFYKQFLNPYGDLTYSRFTLADNGFLNAKGLYCFTIEDIIHYFGRCLDNFKKRFNQGYGKIHPKNCYIDGQSTNCHINALITPIREKVNIFLCPLTISNEEIKNLEKSAIETLNPSWNISLSSKH